MLPDWYNKYKELINKSLENYLINYFKDENNFGLQILKEAVFYSVKGGKKIRAILALEFYLIFTGKKLDDINHSDDIIKFCIAVELLHSYSLIHDDLPSMDNDELRRGKQTVWKKYGEANAILVGDLLNSLSFEILSEIRNSTLINYFGQAVGVKGMIGGQVLDLYYENNPNELNLENLIEVHNKKTGALIEMSVLGGLIIAEKDVNFVKSKETNDIKKYLDFGKKIGLAFQVKDDLLDIEGNKDDTGKSVGGENKGFIFFMGIEKTKKYLENLLIESKNIIEELNSTKLLFLINYIGNRIK